MSFNKEDKICWDELAPSLQDKFKFLQNLINEKKEEVNNRVGDVRVTIGKYPPSNPVEYCEVWFDTNIMALRVFAHRKWTITRAAWYGNSASSVESTTEANLSSNPRTNCHCYTVAFQQEGYCHCKVQLWDSSTAAAGTTSSISFNQDTNKSFNSTTDYRFILNTSVPGVSIASLNCTSEDSPNSDAIPSHGEIVRVKNAEGVYTDFCEFDPIYDQMFDQDSNSAYTVPPGTTVIPLKFANKIKLTTCHGKLFDYSNGPVTITLQANTNGGYMTIYTITLAGNPRGASTCHSNCHCARW